MNPLSKKLTKTITVEIVPTTQGNIEEDRIWAINWFNYKQKWLYSLYNRLASPYVIKVGGQLLFKGHNIKSMFGSEDLARHTLLVVTYPKINNFLEMLTIKAFQLFSVLRVKAVQDFVFGFTRRVDSFASTSTPKFIGSESYLVYHYTEDIEKWELYEAAREHDAKVYFHGEKIAQLKRIEEGKDDVLAPFFMDGIIIFELENEEAMTKFITNPWFERQNLPGNAHYAGIFSRVK